MRIMKALMWPMLLLALASTFIYMAGLASVQNVCQMGSTPVNTNNAGTSTAPGLGGGAQGPAGSGTGPSDTFGVFGMSSSFADCKRTYRFFWFTFAFVLATLLGLLVASFMSAALIRSRPFWMSMLTISTILMMVASETFLAFTDHTEGYGNMFFSQWVHRVRTATAGAIMSVAFLIFLLLAVGTDWRRDDTATTRATAGDKPATGIAGPGVGTGVGPGVAQV